VRLNTNLHVIPALININWW